MSKKYVILFFVMIATLLFFSQCSVLRKSYPTIIGTQCPAHDSCVVYEISFHVPLYHNVKPTFLE